MTMYMLEIKYDIGQPVYLKTDPAQCVHLVTRVCVSSLGIAYELTLGSESSWHYDFEITRERGIIL